MYPGEISRSRACRIYTSKLRFGYMRAVIINRPVESGKFMGKGYHGPRAEEIVKAARYKAAGNVLN